VKTKNLEAKTLKGVSQSTGRKNLICTPCGTHRHRGAVFICKNPPRCTSDQPCHITSKTTKVISN